MDYYLKANSEQELMSKLTEVGAMESYTVKDENDTVIETRYIPVAGYDIDIIGTIYKPTGNFIQQTMGEQTIEVPEMEALVGFHANLRGPVDLAPKVEYIPYVPTLEELNDPNFVIPDPEVITTPSPIAELLVYPTNPVRVWA